MTFNPNMALTYAHELARPRLLGTGEDEIVAQEVVDKLTRFGWQVERQPFEFVTGVNQVIRLVVLTAEILILLIFWAWGISTWFSIPLALLLLALFFSVERLLRAAEAASLEPNQSLLARLCWRLGERYATANFVARLGAPTPKSSEGTVRPHLYLMAHLDSKGQFIPVIIRALLFGVLSGGTLMFAILTLLRAIWPAVTSLGALAGIVALLAGVPLLLLDVDNRSPGAIDNASGLGLVLHLAESLGQEATWREKLDVTVLITSAEELAVMGAAAYVRANLSALQASANTTHILNFDGIGVRGQLEYMSKPGRLLDLTRRACAELSLPLKRFGLGGVLFDHIPFARHGLDALTLTSIGSSSWWVHTAQDTQDKLDEEGFRQGGAVVMKVIEELSDFHHEEHKESQR